MSFTHKESIDTTQLYNMPEKDVGNQNKKKMNNEFLNIGGKDMDGKKTGEVPDIKIQEENIEAENKITGREVVNYIEGKVTNVREGPTENERILEGREVKEKQDDSKRKTTEKAHTTEDNEGTNQHLAMDNG